MMMEFLLRLNLRCGLNQTQYSIFANDNDNDNDNDTAHA
jgi:hypothetical protein